MVCITTSPGNDARPNGRNAMSAIDFEAARLKYLAAYKLFTSTRSAAAERALNESFSDLVVARKAYLDSPQYLAAGDV